MNLRAGCIGLGIMGKPMTLNLIKAGFPVTVYGRRPESVAPLTDAGAAVADSPAALAAVSDVIFINVPDAPDVEAVLFGEKGVATGARPGLIVVDMGTTSPSITRDFAVRLAERGVSLLDAPVSGGEIGAINGALTIMVGGEGAALSTVMPLFQAMGKTITHIGGSGAGQVAKMCNQIVIGGTVMAVAEALLLAREEGVDGARVREALRGGVAPSRVVEVDRQRLVDDNFKPGFKAKLHQKDMRIVSEEARKLGIAMPTAAQFEQYLNGLVGSGLGELDSSAVWYLIERLSRPMGKA